MPRAKIPYDAIDAAIANEYPFPLYSNVRIATVFKDRIRKMTPSRVYDRSTGNFAGIGWKVSIEGFVYRGQDVEFNPIYERFATERVFLL